MTKIRLVSAILILTAVTAAPVLAQDAGMHNGMKRHHHLRAHNQHFRGVYTQTQPNDRYDPDPVFQRNIENFGFSGRDPSRIGGTDPSLNPLGGGR
jgi:hypothetical protein